MKKVTIRSPGSYEKLEFVEAPDLQAQRDEVIIAVRAIGVNFADVCVRLGVYESAKKYVGWPITPGFEVSGIVKSVGPTATKYQVGQEVIGFTRFNGYATEVRIPESQVLALPKGFTLVEGAGFPAVFFTAYHAVYQHAVLPKNAKVLIHSAAGGVGTALVQLCKSEGYFTVGVIGSSHKRAYLEKFGPDVIIDKSQQDLWAEAKKVVPEGYHAIFDANGYSTMRESYEHLCPMGKLIVYGSHDLLSKKGGHLNYIKAGLGLMRTPRFNPLDLITTNRGVIGFNVSFLFDEKEMIEQCIDGMQRRINEGLIRPIPVTQIPFESVADAHRLIESGQSVGKIVLTV
ncbi:MAG: zinc-binding dehydrogenase [Bdellovibrionia bacterium]